MQALKNLKATPHDFQRIGSLGQIDKTSWAKIPTYYYDVTQHRAPLTPTEFNTAFSGSVNLFNEIQTQPGRQTNAETGSGVNEPFLALGVGVVMMGEGLAFTLPGALVDVNRAVTDTCLPQIDGCVADGGGTARNAALWWGSSGWHFMEAFFQRYRLQMKVNRRFLLVDEALFDVGMVPTPPEFEGAGDSLIPGMRFVREINDVLADKGIAKSFLPQNIAGTLCVGAPTSAATFGHPKIAGLGNRIYCFQQPIPIFPGMRFDVDFVPVENDLAVGGFLDSMRRDMVLDVAGGATRPDPNFTETICNTAITGSSWTIPGGTISIGLVFKGFALQPRACVEYVADYMLAGSAMHDMLAGHDSMSEGFARHLNTLAGSINAGRLAGVGEGVDESQESRDDWQRKCEKFVKLISG